jgi:hypothetical protein
MQNKSETFDICNICNNEMHFIAQNEKINMCVVLTPIYELIEKTCKHAFAQA